MKRDKYKQYLDELARTKRQVAELERAGVKVISLQVAADFLPVLPEYR